MIEKEQIEYIAGLSQKYSAKVLFDEALSKHTSFKIGGICPCFVSINSVDFLQEIMSYIKANSLPYYIIGKGTNLLVSDDRIERIFLYIGEDFANVCIDNDIITAQSGASLSQVCKKACENSLGGLEFAYGIPGKVGGGVYMNAGAYGGELKDVIISVDALDDNGNVVTFDKDKLEFEYRKSIFMKNSFVILSAKMKLCFASKEDIQAKMSELMAKRKDKQPLDKASAGSTFKRPAGSYAGMLIEQSGLKGYRVGDAMVSDKHCGFVVNVGNATFKDVMDVITHVQEEVKAQTGYFLECEPEVVTSE